MKLWDAITDPFGTLGKVNDIGGDVFHGITGTPTADEKRNQQKMMNDQIQAYKDQSELTRKELETKQGEMRAEKRRVEEKQIRSLRRNRGMGGFLGVGASDQPGMSDKLGG